MKFYIINQKAELLSCFVRNDLVTKNQLKFSTKGWMFFTSQKEAQSTLDDIIANCRQLQQAQKLSIIEV